MSAAALDEVRRTAGLGSRSARAARRGSTSNVPIFDRSRQAAARSASLLDDNESRGFTVSKGAST